ncbi:MAG: phosphatase PAP2 family protein [Deltaproteobacteria bacterium]|nr:phosphatase PAP2 family protein [Deltaproteobacteria bacterium]
MALGRRDLARAFSIGGHPMLLLPASVLLARLDSGRDRDTAWILGLILGAMAVLAIYVVRAVRRQEVTDIDVSQREQRPRMFAVAIASVSLVCVALWLSGQPPAVLRGAVAALVLLIVCTASNQLGLKASLHTAFAVYAAAVLYSANPAWGAAGYALAIGVGWSRVELQRHTTREVVAGLVLGTAISLGMLLL